jgi:hypothetical protein
VPEIGVGVSGTLLHQTMEAMKEGCCCDRSVRKPQRHPCHPDVTRLALGNFTFAVKKNVPDANKHLITWRTS